MQWEPAAVRLATAEEVSSDGVQADQGTVVVPDSDPDSDPDDHGGGGGGSQQQDPRRGNMHAVFRYLDGGESVKQMSGTTVGVLHYPSTSIRQMFADPAQTPRLVFEPLDTTQPS